MICQKISTSKFLQKNIITKIKIMEKQTKRIDIKEFREKGYLQELNRRFLHPLGMALEVVVDNSGEEKLGGIWDYREDEEGIYYDIKNSDNSRKDRFKANEKFVDEEFESRGRIRKEKLGFEIEEI